MSPDSVDTARTAEASRKAKVGWRKPGDGSYSGTPLFIGVALASLTLIGCSPVAGRYAPMHRGATMHWNDRGKLVTRVDNIPISRLPMYRYGQMHQAMEGVPVAQGFVDQASHSQRLAYAFGAGAQPLFYGAAGTSAAAFIDSADRKATYLSVSAALLLVSAALLGAAYHFSVEEELRTQDALNAYNDAVLGPELTGPKPQLE